MRTARTMIATLTLLLLTAGPALAAERPTGDPKAQVVEASKRIKAIALESEDQDEIVERLTGVMDDLVDYTAFAKKTLKGVWKDLTPEQRQRFEERFKALVIETYGKRFKPKTEFTFTERGETKWMNDEKTLAEVRTTIEGRKVAADVNYLFVPSEVDDEPVWRVTDIVIDGVSMALNWRSQFTRIVDKRGFDTLIEMIEKNLEKKD
ncbi:MAG: MlaC/ttg2D family ABC transporter substrate-binding protein [Myxococcota bacterium]